jgi:hypothetical protein
MIVAKMDAIEDVKSPFRQPLCELAGVPVDHNSETDLEGGA